MKEFSFIQILAALGFFLYGLHLTEGSLRKATGESLRHKVDRLTRFRSSAFLLGVLMTLVFQSSTATVVMLIGFTSIGLLTAKRAIPVVLGADVGTTFLVLLLAAFVQFDSYYIALSILVLGFLGTFIFRQGRGKFYAEGLLGFGMVFFGLSLISLSSVPLRESVLVNDVIKAISSYPMAAMVFAAILTALIQSSAAIIGILLSLASAGVITGTESVAFVLGANLGSTVVPLLAGARSTEEGKRLSFLHLGTKGIGVLFVLPFSTYLGDFVGELTDSPSFQVASIHIFLNVLIAMLFLPLVSIISTWVSTLVPKPIQKKEFGPMYLDSYALNSPTLALANVFREILRVAGLAQEMFSQSLRPFENERIETIEQLEELDDQIDILYRDVKYYLAGISRSELTDEQSERQIELLMLVNGIESIGDVIIKSMLRLAKKKKRMDVSFSKEGWIDIKDFHGKVMENFQLAINSFATNNLELGKKVIRHKRYLATLEQELGQKHLIRLSAGLKESFDTSSIHMDILADLRRVNSIISKMAYPVLDRSPRGDRE